MQSIAERHEEPTAIRTNLGAIFVSLELSRSIWLITSVSPGGGEKMSKHSVSAGDTAALLTRFSELDKKAFAQTGKSFPIIVIQEAGLDGFWIHRALQREGIESYVVDAASIATSRRRRRAKTDRIDGEALVRALLAYKRGEPRVCAMVRAPTPEDEDSRRVCRERKTLTVERIQHINRIKGLLFSQGVSGYEPLRRNRRQRLDELKTGDGRPLPPHLKAQISRELDRLELLIEQIKVVEAERDVLFVPTTKTGHAPAPRTMLIDLRGIRSGICRRSMVGGPSSKLRQSKAGGVLRRLGADALAKRICRARARRLQSRQSKAADDDDSARVAMVATSTGFGAGALVPCTSQTRWWTPAEDDDCRARAQAARRAVEICDRWRRH
jgi:transposase